MGRVSKRVIGDRLREEIDEQLSFTISSLVNKDEVGAFLNEFLTKEEKVMFGKRLVLYMFLQKGFSNTQVTSLLSMSHETVRWHREVSGNKSEAFIKIIERLMKRQSAKELWKKIEKILEPFKLALEAKNNMKARVKLAGGDFWKD